MSPDPSTFLFPSDTGECPSALAIGTESPVLPDM